MDKGSIFRKEVENFGLLSDERTLELVRRKDPDSVNKLIEHNIGLICMMARKNQLHCNNVVEFYDLVQEGVFGIRDATKSYNPDKETKFHRHAARWIQHHISRVLYDNRDVIRKPENILIKEDKINKTSAIFFQKNGYYPNKEELMKLTGFTDEEVNFVLNHKMEFFDLDEGISNYKYSDVIYDQRPLPDDMLAYKEELEGLCWEIQRILANLGRIKERDRSLFRDRYSLGTEEFFNIQSLPWLGKKYSLTKQGVSAAIHRIWRKIDDSGGYKNEEWLLVNVEYARDLEGMAGVTIEEILRI